MQLPENATSATRMELHELRKSYGSNEVLKGVSLRIESGRVHALLGPNGAGKSTLLACLSGAEEPDSGSIVINGEAYRGFTPRTAFEAGTAIIYQHFQLVGDLSVADNVFLGSEQTRLGRIDRAEQHQQTRMLMESLDVDIDPRATVESLSVGEQQIVEIVRALRRQPHVLILDEPTAALGTHEVEALLALVRRLAEEKDIAIVYVTHLLGEVFVIADTVTVLRDGTVHLSESIEDIDMTGLVRSIAPDAALRSAQRARPVGRDLLRLETLQCRYTGPVTITVSEGEILGVFGLLGSGRTDLLETLAGTRHRIAGDISLAGTDVHATTPTAARRHGFSLVASDRNAQSLFSELTALENVLMPHFSKLSRVFRRRRAERRVFDQIAAKVQLTPRDPALPAEGFSGGNAQKLAVARWITGLDETRILLLDEPTQGVDVGARHELYELIRDFASHEGRAVIFASSEPEEVIALADRVVILADGAVVDVVDPSIGEERIIALSQGVDISHERTT